MPEEQKGNELKKREEQPWKQPGQPRSRREEVAQVPGRDSLAAAEDTGQSRWMLLRICTALKEKKLSSIKKKIVPVWVHFSGLEIT